MKKIKLAELTPDNLNANKGTQRGLGQLEKSLQNYGAGRSITVDKNGRIISGNKTTLAAASVGIEDAILVESDGNAVIVHKRTDIDIDTPMGRGLAIADNRVAELNLEWDLDVLEELAEDGIELLDHWTEEELREFNYESPSGDFEGTLADAINGYTNKIKSPIYEPKGDRPEVAELVDIDKAMHLVSRIDEADIDEKVKVFLRHAAMRHAVFDYGAIAEFYAHASADIQALMEDSALVIIDFNKAIEDGFVKLSHGLAEAFEDNE